MTNSALIVIDMQQAIADEGPYQFDKVLDNIKYVIDIFRSKMLPVIYIQHSGQLESPFEPGTDGWQIIESVKPLDSELIIHKKFNSAFKDTKLESELRKLDTKKIVIVGMQTEFCIDTTIRVAFEKGFEVIVPEFTNTTLDTELLSAKEIYNHHNSIFNNRFAIIKKITEL